MMNIGCRDTSVNRPMYAASGGVELEDILLFNLACRDPG